MAYLLLPWRRKIKPASRQQLNYANPISRSIVAFWMNDTLSPVNLAGNGGDLVWTTNTVEPGTVVVNVETQYERYVNSTHDYASPAGDSFDPIGAGDDVTVFANIVSNANDTARQFFRRGIDGAGAGWSLAFVAGNVPTFATVLTSGGAASFSAVGTTSVFNTTPKSLVGRLVQNSAIDIWNSGIKEATTSVTKTSLRTSTKGISLAGNASPDPNTMAALNFYGYVGPVVVWNRGCADDEIREFASTPNDIYQLLVPDPVRLYSFASGSSVPTLSGFTVDNITATTARHSLTLTF